MGRGKGISFPFPASPGRTFFSPLPRPHSPLIYHTTQRVPCGAERERERERPRKLQTRSLRIRHRTNEQGTRAKIHPQVFLGLLVGKSRSAFGQFFPLSPVTVPEVFTKVNTSQFPSGIVFLRRASLGEPFPLNCTIF